MEAQLVQLPAQVMGLAPRADRSWKLIFETRELGGEDVAFLADNLHGEGWLLFKPNAEITAPEIPADNADSGTKSTSQRLRDVIFVLWKQRGGRGDFDTFYRVSLEKLIDHIKGQLQEEV